MEKQRLWIRWLGGSLLTISLLFFSNGNVSAAKILTKYGSLPLYREDLMPLTVERPSFYDDPPLWTIRLRNQPQGLLAPETGFYRPIYGIMLWHHAQEDPCLSHGTAPPPAPKRPPSYGCGARGKAAIFGAPAPSLQRHAPASGCLFSFKTGGCPNFCP